MKRIMYVVVVVLAVFFCASVGSGGDGSFDTEKIMSELESTLQLSRKKLDSLKPTIDEKSRQLKKTIQESVDKGFVQLDEMNRSLDTMSRNTEEKVKSFLSSEEVEKLKEYLGKIDKDAIVSTQEKLVAELTEALELTESQIEELKPVLKENMARLNEMIKNFAAERNKNWDEFKKQYQEMSRDLKEKLQQSLDNDQMEKLEQYNEEKRGKIQRALFV